jgi:WD40 repeat protein/energy-coupling factor transporter ATP-binding protein EcfA2
MAATAVQVELFGCPFRGLRPFSKEESDLFFGREGQSDELARKLGETRFVAVVGTSGSGKSSLVRAGLLPSLDSGCLVKAGANWRVVDMRPGGNPIKKLATALDEAQILEAPVDPESLGNSSLALVRIAQTAYETKRLQADENLLILVDQFEELFRYKCRNNTMQDTDQKAVFVKLLLGAAKQREFPVYVVITMRSEFLGDCAAFRDLPEAINCGQYLIPRMSREQRRQAIEGPIHMAGGDIAPRLVQRILNEVGEDPGQLPVMQHALLRTWIHWKNQGDLRQPIDRADYEAVGAMEEAVSKHADEAFDEARRQLGVRGATIVKRLFQRLSNRDQYGRETRRPTGVQELMDVCEASLEEIDAAVDCFRRERRNFLTPTWEKLSPSSEIDVTHECLLSRWRVLCRDWNPEEEESRRVYVRVLGRARDAVYESGEAGSGTVRFREYLSGYLLDRSLAWWNQRQPNVAWARRYMTDEGRREDNGGDAQFALAHRYLLESKKHETRARFGRYFAALGVGGVAVVVFAGFLYWRRSEIATAKEKRMEAELASNVVSQHEGPKDDPRASAFRAAQSLRHRSGLAAQTILLQALEQLPEAPQPLPTRNAVDTAFSADGNWLAVAGQASIDLYEVDTGKKSQSFDVPGPVSKLLFPTSFFFMAAVDTKILIWQYNDKKKDWAHVDIEPECPSPSRLRDFTANQAGTLLALSCAMPNDSRMSGSARSTAMKADQETISALALWTPTTNKVQKQTDEDCASQSSLALSSDGTRLAYVCATDKGWTLRMREIVREGKDNAPSLGASRVFLVLERRETPRSTGKQGVPGERLCERYPMATKWSAPGGIRALRFDPTNANVVLLVGTDDTVRSFNCGESTASLRTVERSVLNATWDKKGGENSKATYSSSGLYGPAPNEGYKFAMLEGAQQLSFSEDGRWIVVTKGNHVAKVWDAKEISSERLIAHVALNQPIKSIAISRASEHVAAVTDDGLAYLCKLKVKRDDFGELSLLQGYGAYAITHNDSDIFLGTSKIIDTHNHKTVASFGYQTDQHNRPLSISKDGSLIARVSDKGVLTVNEFTGGKIGTQRWESHFPDDSFYVTSFGFSRDDHHLLGAFRADRGADAGKIWLAVWDFDKPDMLPSRILLSENSSYDLLSGNQVIVTTPNRKEQIYETRVYDAATGRSIDVPWEAHDFAAFDLSPDHKTIVGAEVEKGCISQEGEQAETRGSQIAGAKQRYQSVVKLLDRETGRQRSSFAILNHCVHGVSVSANSRYVLVLVATGAEEDSRTEVQLWDIQADPPVETAEVRNGAAILDADIAQDSRELVLVDSKRVLVTPWQEDDLVRELCTRVVPNEEEKKEFLEACPDVSSPSRWRRTVTQLVH